MQWSFHVKAVGEHWLSSRIKGANNPYRPEREKRINRPDVRVQSYALAYTRWSLEKWRRPYTEGAKRIPGMPRNPRNRAGIGIAFSGLLQFVRVHRAESC